MTSIMRRTVRGAAAGAGALAIIMGAAACGGLTGGGDEGDGEAATTEEAPAEEGSETEEEAEAESEGDAAEEETEESEGDAADSEEEGGDTAAGPLSEEDLTAAGDAYFAFFEALIAKDGEAGCGIMLNPATGGPYEGGEQEACIETFEKMTESFGFDESMKDMFDRSMFEGVDNGDGTASITMAGTDAEVVLVKGDDGAWYIDTSKTSPAAG